jgi:protein-tyrosine phosphatase
VHCAQGHGRSGLFAIAFLAERNRIQSLDEGLALIKAARPGVGLNSTQVQFLRIYIVEQGKGEAPSDTEGSTVSKPSQR